MEFRVKQRRDRPSKEKQENLWANSTFLMRH